MKKDKPTSAHDGQKRGTEEGSEHLACLFEIQTRVARMQLAAIPIAKVAKEVRHVPLALVADALEANPFVAIITRMLFIH